MFISKKERGSFLFIITIPRAIPRADILRNHNDFGCYGASCGWDVPPNNPPGSPPIAYSRLREDCWALQAHASGVVGFSFARGRKPRAKLNPSTERSDIEDCWALQAHASGVLAFNFARGRRPGAKLNPSTEQSDIECCWAQAGMPAEVRVGVSMRKAA